MRFSAQRVRARAAIRERLRRDPFSRSATSRANRSSASWPSAPDTMRVPQTASPAVPGAATSSARSSVAVASRPSPESSRYSAMAAASSSTPLFSVATVRTIVGCQPFCVRRELQHGVKLLLQAFRAVAIGFVQHKNVRNFHQTGLHVLHVVAQAGNEQHQRAIGQSHDIDFILAHADGLDQYNLLARRIEKQARHRPWCAQDRRENRAWPSSE